MSEADRRQTALQELLRDGKLAGCWTLDAARSTIGLKSKSMWGMVSVKGVFREVTGSGTVSAAGDVAGTITVAAGSIDTKVKKRDKHLRSADFFDVAQPPRTSPSPRSTSRRPARASPWPELSPSVTAPVRCPSPRVSLASTGRRWNWTARCRSTGRISASPGTSWA